MSYLNSSLSRVVASKGKSFPATLLAFTLLTMNLVGAESGFKYTDDPQVIKIIKELKPGEVVKLPKFKVLPKDATKYHSSFKNGPGVRNYGNKMPYVPGRKTGIYCGANHGAPHRLNDVWEYHLGANTWRLLCPPGSDSTVNAPTNEKIKALKKNEAKNKDEIAALETKIKQWWKDSLELTEGYLHDKGTMGPALPVHTWDGVTYDTAKNKLYWDTTDTNTKLNPRRGHFRNIERYAENLGLDAEVLKKQVKPASSLYMYTPGETRWRRQQGEGPFPRMLGQGASLHYIPDIDRTIYYCCVGNVTGGSTEGMWSYDATANLWKELIKGSLLVGMVKKKNIAPGAELQLAYSSKHKKLVAVCKNQIFIYDIAANKWSKGKDTLAYAHDSTSTFVYDSNADRFLLLSRGGKSHHTKTLFALYVYDLNKDEWTKLETPILHDDKLPTKWKRYRSSYAGYYDPIYNVFVLCGKDTTYIYRHKESVAK